MVDAGARPASRVLALLAGLVVPVTLAVPLAGPSFAAPRTVSLPSVGVLAGTVSAAPDTLAEGEQVTVTGTGLEPGARLALCQRAADATTCQPGSRTAEVQNDGTFSAVLPARAYSDAATCSTPGACVVLAADPAGSTTSAPLTVNPTPAKWWRLRGIGSEVDVGANGGAWMVGREVVPGGHDLSRFNGQHWIPVDAGAEHVAVGKTGRPWIVTDTGAVLERTLGEEWLEHPGPAASDIAVGADDTVWITGQEAVEGGHELYRLTGDTWTKVPGAAERLAVDATGEPWIVTNTGAIYQRAADAWERRPGIARDIDVGADGSIWVVGTNAVSGGFAVYEWTGSRWRSVSGGADRIASDPAGQAWVVNLQGEVYRRLRSVEG